MRTPTSGVNRAEFLASISALGLALATGGCEQILKDIANRPTRRNIANLASNDPILQAYRSAISQMQGFGPTDVLNWSMQASIHQNHCPHGNWWLLPWHRAYLVYFERICRKLSGDATFALPYWNWADNHTVPAVFYANDVLNDHADSASVITIPGEFVDHSVLEPIMQETNFLVFGSGKVTGQRDHGVSGPLEYTPHNNVHTTFPFTGDMYHFMSPLDPIFWTHHCMLDYCWTDWNINRNNSNPSDPDWNNMTFTEFFDENRNPVSLPVAITPLFPIFDYQYEPSQIGTSPPKMKKIRSRAEAEQLKKIVQQGAPSAIPVINRFALTQAVQVNVGTAALGRIPVPRQALDAALARGSGQRVLLTLQHVEQPAKADFFVRVFVNAPGPVSADTPITDPHYAGSFGFFVHGGGGMANMSMGEAGAAQAGFVVDIGEALRRAGAADAVDVQLVAVPYPGRETAPRGVTVGAFELAIARLAPAKAAKDAG